MSLEYIDRKPKYNNSFYTSNDIYSIASDLIFVFGSNLSGIHGRGGALYARTFLDAKLGVGEGLTGKSYALPTKDKNIKTLPIEQIAIYVSNFIQFQKSHPELSFFVTAIGTGLAKYSHSDIAPLFKGVNNCWLPSEWEPYLSKDEIND